MERGTSSPALLHRILPLGRRAPAAPDTHRFPAGAGSGPWPGIIVPQGFTSQMEVCDDRAIPE